MNEQHIKFVIVYDTHTHLNLFRLYTKSFWDDIFVYSYTKDQADEDIC